MFVKGEIFGGIEVPHEKNDAESLLYELESCCLGNENRGKSVPDVLSSIRGPWALIYWQVLKLEIVIPTNTVVMLHMGTGTFASKNIWLMT